MNRIKQIHITKKNWTINRKELLTYYNAKELKISLLKWQRPSGQEDNKTGKAYMGYPAPPYGTWALFKEWSLSINPKVQKYKAWALPGVAPKQTNKKEARYQIKL